MTLAMVPEAISTGLDLDELAQNNFVTDIHASQMTILVFFSVTGNPLDSLPLFDTNICVHLGMNCQVKV